jgi:hypothetical protein
MGARKDISQILKRAKKAGATVEHRTKHWRVTTPGGQIIGVSCTPKKSYDIAKIKADFKRHRMMV